MNINVEIAIMFLPKIHITKYTLNIHSWIFQWASPLNSTLMGGSQCVTEIQVLSLTLQGGIFFPPIRLLFYSYTFTCCLTTSHSRVCKRLSAMYMFTQAWSYYCKDKVEVTYAA